MNDFCMTCTNRNTAEIINCNDRNCPFWGCRKRNLPYQEEGKKPITLLVPFDGSIGSPEIFFSHKK